MLCCGGHNARAAGRFSGRRAHRPAGPPAIGLEEQFACPHHGRRCRRIGPLRLKIMNQHLDGLAEQRDSHLKLRNAPVKYREPWFPEPGLDLPCHRTSNFTMRPSQSGTPLDGRPKQGQRSLRAGNRTRHGSDVGLGRFGPVGSAASRAWLRG